MRHDSVVSRIISRIRKNVWGNCSRAERPYKEMTHVKDRIESDLQWESYNSTRNTKKVGDQNCTWWYTLWSSDLTKTDKLRIMVVGIFTRCRRIYKKDAKKCKELRNSTYTTFMAQRSAGMETCGSCLHY